ncbi:serine hydrolase domain-containing protein [Paenibacillus xanthanilyticus]|uniref:Serine hydrolase domain-containing protein n=1 Tax=Paenibacillus xanthanilyticus TaxID=1783531 RepID=A0ABV8JZA4_9BACL
MQRIDRTASSWPTPDPAAVGMDTRKLAGLEAVIASEYANINAVVVARNGALAYERYWRGVSPDHPHHVASVTKSVLSALIGLAIEDGHIRDVDQKVLEFFPAYRPAADNGVIANITIRHLLTMTAPYPFEAWREPLDQLCMQPDWAAYTMGKLGRGGNIGDFKYSTSGAHLLSVILTRSTGSSAREFANERLFRPLGMREIPAYGMTAYGFDELFGHAVRGWVEDPSGHSTGGWGLTLTPRDMARFGLLYLNQGRWGDAQILSPAWIDASTAVNAHGYGYLWWVREEDGRRAFMALGDGGSAICCLPDYGIVVAITSEFMPQPRDRWGLIKEHILPAVAD